MRGKDPEIVSGHEAGLIGRMTMLEATDYKNRWGLGLRFEAVIAKGLADFFTRYDASRDAIFRVVTSEEPLAMGTLALDVSGRAEEGEGALRWFFLHPELCGRGLGKALMGHALAHGRALGLSRVVVETFEGLEAAISIYEAHGFRLESRWKGEQWGRVLMERRYLLEL